MDELAHTNAPGSRHAKRWEDVAELVTAGLHVWATLNIQHLESLNDDVARITGVRVAETLPDRVLEMADEIELIDVTPADLRERLREGRIYRPDTAKRALEGFFKEGNLAALREIALRRAAAHVDTDVRDWMRRTGVSGPWPAGERVLALIGADAASEAVVRQAKRLADALHAPWTALHVERDSSITEARPALALATQLGAEVQIRAGPDLVRATLEAANAGNATHIVMGRAPAPFWRRVTGRTLGTQLLRRTGDFALHVVPLPATTPRRRTAPRQSEGWVAWLAGPVVVTIVTAAGSQWPLLPGEAMGMVYLAAVVVAASQGGLRTALATGALAFLAWDFFFIPPLYAVAIGSPRDVVALMAFAAVAALTGGLAGRVRRQAGAAQARIEGLRRIVGFSRKLGPGIERGGIAGRTGAPGGGHRRSVDRPGTGGRGHRDPRGRAGSRRRRLGRRALGVDAPGADRGRHVHPARRILAVQADENGARAPGRAGRAQPPRGWTRRSNRRWPRCRTRRRSPGNGCA